jgi:hypothetical protein
MGALQDHIRRQLPKQGLWLFKKPILLLLTSAIVLIFFILPTRHWRHESPSKYGAPGAIPLKAAGPLSPKALMARPLVGTTQDMPKIYHQYVPSAGLLSSFREQSSICKARHPDWEWVLWTDDDNFQMMQKYVPWLLPAWKRLSGKENRSDWMRPLYMFLFGG